MHAYLQLFLLYILHSGVYLRQHALLEGAFNVVRYAHPLLEDFMRGQYAFIIAHVVVVCKRNEPRERNDVAARKLGC